MSSGGSGIERDARIRSCLSVEHTGFELRVLYDGNEP
jgi:hypothetical protein